MKISRTALPMVLVAGLVVVGAADAQQWDANHPARATDNGRLATQNARITHGVRNGQLSHAQAHQLRADDRSIRSEERADASVHGTHLSGHEQRQIHAQENANSAAIRDERHPQ